MLHCIALPCLCLCLAYDCQHEHSHTHLVVALTSPCRRRRQSTPSAAAADFRPPSCSALPYVCCLLQQKHALAARCSPQPPPHAPQSPSLVLKSSRRRSIAHRHWLRPRSMSGDLSLSQSHGGLRIANPDDDTPGSPVSPPPNQQAPPSSHSSTSTVTNDRRPDLLPALSHQRSDYASSLDFQPDEYNLQTTNVSPTATQQPLQPPAIQRIQQEPQPRVPLTHRTSGQLDYQAQQGTQYPTHAPGYGPQMRQHGSQSGDIRPISGMYSQGNASASSGFIQQSYSYRSEMSSADGGPPALTRHGSGGPRQGMGPLPIRDGSRVYRQPSQQANGPLPPRRNSRRTRPPPGSNVDYENNGDAAYAGNGSMPRNAEDWR